MTKQDEIDFLLDSIQNSIKWFSEQAQTNLKLHFKNGTWFRLGSHKAFSAARTDLEHILNNYIKLKVDGGGK